MTNGSYVNAQSDILLHLKPQLPSRACGLGMGVGGVLGVVKLKVRLDRTRSATSINTFKLLFQIHHSHSDQCSCPRLANAKIPASERARRPSHERKTEQIWACWGEDRVSFTVTERTRRLCNILHILSATKTRSSGRETDLTRSDDDRKSGSGGV